MEFKTRLTNRLMRALCASVTVVIGCALVALCTASPAAASGKTISINVGGGKVVKISKPLHIAYFDSASTNALGSNQQLEVNKLAKKYGLDVTDFDAAFNATTQFNQIQSAIESHKYNVLLTFPVDGETICRILSVTAPAQNILVSDFDQPLCGRFVHEGTQLWQQGTLNYISGYNTRATFRSWFEEAAKLNTGPQNVGVLEGVITDGDSQDVAQDMQIFKTEHPNFHFLSRLNTAYTAETGYQQALAMLHAHPNIRLIMSDASAITQGAARAIQQLGLQHKVKIADYGAAKEIVPLIKSGIVEFSMPARPRTEADYVFKQLLDAVDGKTVPRFTNIPAPFITKSNVNSYKPEY